MMGSDWIELDGGGVLEEAQTAAVFIRRRDGREVGPVWSSMVRWTDGGLNDQQDYDVVAYRVASPAEVASAEILKIDAEIALLRARRATLVSRFGGES